MPLAAPLAALLLCAALQSPAPVPAGQEGPLANDTFVATRADLEESLRSGDRLVLEARANPTTAASSLAQAMDAWRRALTGDGPGVWVRGEDREGLASQAFPREAPDWARAYWSPTEAVAWRLAALAPEERAVWPERFEPLADEALAAAPWSEPHLVRIERDFAFTRAAALAALRLCDLELESARFHAAASFLGRAERHAAWASASDGLRAAFAARRAWLPGPAAPTPPADDRRWRSAQSWRLERRPGHLAPGERAPLGLGARPGMVFTSDGAVIVQTPRALVTLTMDGDGYPQAGAAKVEGLAQFTQEGSLFPLAPASTGGLPHLPLLAGRRLFLVVDRARPGSVQFDLPIPPRSNHLLALDRDFEGGFVAAWARASEGLRVGKGDWMPDGPEGQWEWQPGPVLVDGELWVLGRSLPPAAGSDAEAAPAEAFVELFAFDTVEGHQRHRMTLHKAADLAGRDPSSMAGGIPTSCMPLGLDAASGQVLVCSNQGLCGLFEAADGRGRLMLITRRRAPREAGWPGSARPAVQGSEAWFTPFDSDRAYRLQLDRQAPPWHTDAILPQADRLALAALDERGSTWFARRGARSLVRTEPSVGAAQTGPLLGRQEWFTGRAARAFGSLWFATDSGVYRLQESAELRLSQRLDLSDLGAGIGGDLWRQGDRLWILGADTLWLLLPE